MPLITSNIFVLKKLGQLVFLVVFACALFICPGQKANGQEASAPTPVVKTGKEVVFSQKDRENAVKNLAKVREAFSKEIAGLSAAQLNFREGEGRWSVAEVAEHIIFAEKALLPLVAEKISASPVPDGKESFRIKDQAVWMAITNRTTTFKAPPRAQPKGLYKSSTDITTDFEAARNKTIDFVKTTKIDLRSHFADNPVMGVIDAYQWVIFINGHTYRHLDQIRKIKSHPDFPKN